MRDVDDRGNREYQDADSEAGAEAFGGNVRSADVSAAPPERRAAETAVQRRENEPLRHLFGSHRAYPAQIERSEFQRHLRCHHQIDDYHARQHLQAVSHQSGHCYQGQRARPYERNGHHGEDGNPRNGAARRAEGEAQDAQQRDQPRAFRQQKRARNQPFAHRVQRASPSEFMAAKRAACLRSVNSRPSNASPISCSRTDSGIGGHGSSPTYTTTSL